MGSKCDRPTCHRMCYIDILACRNPTAVSQLVPGPVFIDPGLTTPSFQDPP